MSLPAASSGVSPVERQGGSFRKEIGSSALRLIPQRVALSRLLPIFVSVADSNRSKRANRVCGGVLNPKGGIKCHAFYEDL